MSTIKRTEINKIVMDYLVAEGYERDNNIIRSNRFIIYWFYFVSLNYRFKEAAEKFKLEAGIEISRLNDDALSETNEQLDQRIEIRAAIEEGNISSALWLINQHYPELIDHNRALFFKLQVSDFEFFFFDFKN